MFVKTQIVNEGLELLEKIFDKINDEYSYLIETVKFDPEIQIEQDGDIYICQELYYNEETEEYIRIQVSYFDGSKLGGSNKKWRDDTDCDIN